MSQYSVPNLSSTFKIATISNVANFLVRNLIFEFFNNS